MVQSATQSPATAQGEQPMNRTLIVHKDQVSAFARWSRDINPLHVSEDAARSTFFGRTITHGMLTAIEVLCRVTPALGEALHDLDMEFRGAVYPDMPYQLDWCRNDKTLELCLRSNSQLTLVLRGQYGVLDSVARSSIATPLLAKPQSALRSTAAIPLDHPIATDFADMPVGLEAWSQYVPGSTPCPVNLGSALSPAVARIFALLSYLVGMEMPGLRSLLTRVQIQFASLVWQTQAQKELCEHPLLYHWRIRRREKLLRTIQLEVHIYSGNGTPLAYAVVDCYVRFSPIIPDVASIAQALPADLPLGTGKTALVCGGGRGLGAEMAATLALLGWQTHVICRNPASPEPKALAAGLQAHGRQVTFWQGDLGDGAQCIQIAEQLARHCDGLDLLVLNACDPPQLNPQRQTAHNDQDAFDEYVIRSLRLARTPLETFIPLLRTKNGALLAISSSFVDDPPRGLAHYVAAKQAVEGLVRSISVQHPELSCQVARPPKLLTSWNDSPTHILGALPSWQAALHTIVDLCRTARPGTFRLLTDYTGARSYTAACRKSDHASATGETSRIALVGSFTLNPLQESLSFWGAQLGQHIEPIWAPYGQVIQQLLQPGSQLVGADRSMPAVLVRVGDWLRELPKENREDGVFVQQFLDERVEELLAAIQTFLTRTGRALCVMLCPTDPTEVPAEWISAAEQRLRHRMSALPAAKFLDAVEFHDSYEVPPNAIHDPIRNKLGHIPYTELYYDFLGTLLVRVWHQSVRSLRKVVVVDCDNTLWQGVVGEVGAEGVRFEEHHFALHALLNRFIESGILVCLCSKNVEGDVWSVFEQRSELALKRENIVAAMINWQPKSANLRALAARLNLGLESFIFLDDNPIECAEVRSECPEVLTLLWPTDTRQAMRLLRHVWEFDVAAATAEDRKRVRMYREEFQRQELRQKSLTLTEFLESLHICTNIAPVTEQDLPRVAQLTQRTNQFNFTTIRRTEEALRTLLSDARVECWAVRVHDRLGDYGLVGAMITRLEGECLYVDTFLLSCRVLGRGVEYEMMRHLGRRAAELGASHVDITVRFTERNAPARQFLEAIADPGRLTRTAEQLHYRPDTAVLQSLQFDPEKAGESSVTEHVESQPPAGSRTDASTVRSRELTIEKTIRELATATGIHQAVRGIAPTKSSDHRLDAPTDAEEIHTWVYQVFAEALGKTHEELRTLDRLDQLGCDSFKIVQITARLMERYPNLPTTLLFEEQSVSAVARAVARRTAKEKSTLPIPAVHAGGTPERHPTKSSLEIAVVGMAVASAGQRQIGRASGASKPPHVPGSIKGRRTVLRRIDHGCRNVPPGVLRNLTARGPIPGSATAYLSRSRLASCRGCRFTC